MKPKVLIVVGQLRAGGLERQLCYLLESVDREACDWTLVVWSHHENDFHVPRIRKLGISLHFFDPDWPAWSKLGWHLSGKTSMLIREAVPAAATPGSPKKVLWMPGSRWHGPQPPISTVPDLRPRPAGGRA